MKMSPGIRKAILLSLLCLIVSLLAGCELVDLVKKVINNIYGSLSEICVVVYPPYPTEESANFMDNIKNISLAENVKRGLINGVDAFNSVSERTTIIPIYCNDRNEVKSFYEQFFKKLFDDQRRAVCRGKVEEIRRDPRWRNTSCIIFGVFTDNPNATSLNIQLFYYDYAKDMWSTNHGVVNKSDTRAREADLGNLMKALLKKVYD